MMGAGKDKANYLGRDSFNKNISFNYTAIKAPNGELVVAPNCLQCHGQVFENQLYIGLGNTSMDFSDSKSVSKNPARLYSFLSIGGAKKFEAAKNFLVATKTIGPYLQTEVRGVNAADRLAGVLVAHRDPVTFEWMDKPVLQIPDEVVPTDVPAWWLLKKKNAMFYNGLGRGDFGRFLMASNLLTVSDTAESREVDSHFNDVLAYINSIQPPKFPKPINHDLALQGKPLFNDHCSKCHGTYGDEAKYPNLLIPAAIIKTDSALYKTNYSSPQFVEWFNKSWFTTGDHPAQLVPFKGYIAPPLDGIWITAPYFHNGSVPTLEAVLNSKLRPTYWSRNFDNPEYGYNDPGWKHTVLAEPAKGAYNTTLPGYGNYGHYFGDKLNDKERKAVVEYLKTL
jgi:mono/diheme cytochrome c family protein